MFQNFKYFDCKKLYAFSNRESSVRCNLQTKCLLRQGSAKVSSDASERKGGFHAGVSISHQHCSLEGKMFIKEASIYKKNFILKEENAYGTVVSLLLVYPYTMWGWFFLVQRVIWCGQCIFP